MLPIYALKERMHLDISGIAVSMLGVAAKLGYQITGHIGDWHLRREYEGVTPLHHFAVGDLGVFAAEGRIAYEHFEHYYAQRPPVT